MKLVGWMLSLGLVACFQEPAPVEGATPEVVAPAPSPASVEGGAVSAQSREGQRTKAKPAEARPRLKIADIVWGKTKLCTGGECTVALEENRAEIVLSLKDKWYCCCKGTIEDSPGGCQCASKINCDGCSC